MKWRVFPAGTPTQAVWPLRLHDGPPRLLGKAQSRYRSPPAKTPPPGHPTFRTYLPAPRAAGPTALPSDTARHDRADRTAHTAPGTTAAPGEPATDRSTHADATADAGRAELPR